MRKLLLWLLLLCGLTIHAQTVDTSTYTKKADYRLQHLDKSPITTGILYDRVYPAARLQDFNQGSRQDTSSATHFVQAEAEIQTAHYSPPASLPAAADLQAYADGLAGGGTVPLGVLVYDFNQIDPDAASNNLLRYQNGFWYDVAGRTASPYFQKRAVVASVLAGSVALGSVSFRLPSELVFTNTGLSVSSVAVDFNDGGGMQTLAPGGAAVTVSYASGGTKVLRLTVTLSNGIQKTTYARLTVSGAAGCPGCRTASDDYVKLFKPCFRQTVTATDNFTAYETEPFPNVPGRGNVLYYYGGNKTCTPNGTTKLNVTKPIIVLDGFDPQDTRPGEEIYGRYLTYANNGQPDNLGALLRAENTDVVILNFPNYEVGRRPFLNMPNGITVNRDGGADYVERNAFVLVSLLQDINAQLQAAGSTEKIIIIGPSMGGLISRYALAYMEKNNIPHNTKLWVSFDSPHQGANIPIGAQRFLRYFGANGQPSAQKALDEQLNNAAAKQMLLHHHLANSDIAAGAPGFRDRFVQALNTNGLPGSNGFPQNLRRVALVNGAINGTRYGTACERVMTMTSLLALGIFNWTAASGAVTAAGGELYFSGSNGNACKTFYGYTRNSAGEVSNNAALSNSISYDIAPGGSYNTVDQIAGQGQGFSAFKILGTNTLFGTSTSFNRIRSNHCFIPTKSSLAFTGTNRDLGEDLSGRNLVCTGETSFQAYYAPTTNEEHVFLTAASVTWILNEINGTPPPPPLPGYSVAGSSVVCGNASFSVTPTLPGGSTVSWSSNTTGLAVNSATGQATRQNGYNGSATVTASVTTTCGTTPLTRSVWVGTPTVQQMTFGVQGTSQNFTVATVNRGLSANTWYTIRANVQPEGATSMTWSPNVNVSGYTTGFDVYNFRLNAGQTVNIMITATNSCGVSATRTVTFTTSSFGGFMAVYPNPTSDQLNIAAAESPEEVAKASNGMAFGTDETVEAEVTLLTAYNQPLRKGKLRKGRVSFDLKGIPDGLYLLRMEGKDFSETRQVLVRH